MTPRYGLALDNLTGLLDRTKQHLHEKDLEQLREDIYYLRIFQRAQVPQQKDNRRSKEL